MSPKPVRTILPENDSTNTRSRSQTPDTPSEDLYEIYRNAPNNDLPRQSFEPEIEKEPRNLITSQPQETQTEHPNQQPAPTTQTDNGTTSELTNTIFCASSGKQLLLDNDVFYHFTTEEGNNIIVFEPFQKSYPRKEKPQVLLFPHEIQKIYCGWTH